MSRRPVGKSPQAERYDGRNRRKKEQKQKQQMDQLAQQVAAFQDQLQILQQQTHQQAQNFIEEKKEMKAQIDELKNQQVNQNLASTTDMKTAEQVNFFQGIFTPLVYAAGPPLNAAQNYQIKLWDQFLNDYTPKLKADIDASNWFGVFENSCRMHDIPLAKSYQKLYSCILSKELQAKLLKKSARFFENANTDRERYRRLRKWLCTDDKLMKSVADALAAVKSWSRTQSTLLLNYDSYIECIEHYIYTVRFAVTHGINQNRFDIPTETFLFINFVQKVGEDRIRQDADKFSTVRNLSVLGLVVKSLNKEVSVPTEYKEEALFLNDITNSQDEFEQARDEHGEIYFVRRNRNRRNWRSNNWRSNNSNYTSNRFSNSNNSNKKRQPRITAEEEMKQELCLTCVAYGHGPDKCLRRHVQVLIETKKKEGGSGRDIWSLVTEFRRKIRELTRQRNSISRPPQNQLPSSQQIFYVQSPASSPIPTSPIPHPIPYPTNYNTWATPNTIQITPSISPVPVQPTLVNPPNIYYVGATPNMGSQPQIIQSQLPPAQTIPSTAPPTNNSTTIKSATTMDNNNSADKTFSYTYPRKQ